MSLFLPENAQPQATAATQFTPGSPATTQNDVALMQRVFQAAAANPLMIPPDLMAYIFDYIQTGRLQIPIGQVFGFSGFTAQMVQDTAEEDTVTDTTFADFASGGPALSGIPAGRYVIIIACDIRANSSSSPRMGYSINGADPDATKSCTSQVSGGFMSVAQVALETLTDPANTLTAQRRIDVATGNADFGFRSILALRYSNL